MRYGMGDDGNCLGAQGMNIRCSDEQAMVRQRIESMADQE
jgi:hypothetical protein